MTIIQRHISDALVLTQAAGEQAKLLTPHPTLNLTYVLGRLLAAEHSLQSANQELEYYEQTASFRKTLDRERQARRERTP